MAKVGVLGSGDVGKVLALGFKKHGHDVRIGSREGTKLAGWSAENGVAEGTFEAVAAHGEVLVLGVAGRVAEELVKSLARSLEGKTVIDATNPIAGGPVNGILPYFTGPNDSLMERLQKAAPGARFVKAFSSVGNAFMVNPSFPGGRPTMFIAGDDAGAKAQVTGILEQFGWDAEDVGGVEGARAIEPLCQLWCAPGFLRNQWAHAFKVLRM
ncbi:MAG: NAD(P)-binding domain-containing protein [Deltaproteobacteria bacterium]|nr:NAD(P)-binding domain-containing protein [Deltaproteobacteria bacterium]